MADPFVLTLLLPVLTEVRVAVVEDVAVAVVDEVGLIVEDAVVDAALAVDVAADEEVLEVVVAEGMS